MILSLSLLVLFLLYVIIKYLSRNLDYWKVRGVPYVRPVSVFGNCLDLVLQKYHSAIWMSNIYKSTKDPYVGVYLLNRPGLIIRSPEIIKHFLVRDFHMFQNRSIGYATGEHDPLTQHAVGFALDEEWKYLRGKLTPMFTGSKLKSMLSLIIAVGENMKKYLDKTESDLDIKAVSERFAIDVVACCFYGSDNNAFDHEHEFTKTSQLIFNVNYMTSVKQVMTFLMPDLARILRVSFIDTRAAKYFKNIFLNYLKQRENSQVIKHRDLIIEALLSKEQDNNEKENIILDENQICAQPLQFLLAGYDTTSLTISFCLYELSDAKGIQSKLRDEIRGILREEGSLTYESLKKMTYLDMCIKETLRKYPILPFLERRCLGTYQLPDSGVIINEGTMIIVPVWAMHHDPDYYPEPEKFNPERFSQENHSKLNQYTYLPFGVGPRNCIGERFAHFSTKVALVQILAHFKVVRTPETPKVIELERKSFFLAPKTKLFLKLVKDIE